jgi:murein DD-endopeptidase MepM/ murein hydrolase activator NlpD
MKVLVVGWIAGGAFVVLISAPAATKRVTHAARESVRVATQTRPLDGTAGRPSTSTAAPRFTAADAMIIPVLGIEAASLRDNFDHARGGGRTHHALDIMAPHGTPVIAAVDGTIRKLFTSKGGGLTIYQFNTREERVYYYAHLARYADGLAEGQFVAQGTVIGYVGVTGNSAPDAPHLHFSVEVLPLTKEWWKGVPLNPYPMLVPAATTRASVLP